MGAWNIATGNKESDGWGVQELQYYAAGVGLWPGNPTPETKSPAPLLIDYVRIDK